MPGNTRLLVTGALAMVLLMMAIHEGSGECCYSYKNPNPPDAESSGICGDCTSPTPYCGYGPCNIFGCNCDGGCRTGACEFSGRRRDVFGAVDRDLDGRVTMEEALAFLRDTPLPAGRVKAMTFKEMDLDGDGFLTRDEMDLLGDPKLTLADRLGEFA